MSIRKLWDKIAEPRHLKAFYFIVYLIAIWVGAVTFLHPPASIEGALGTGITQFWAALIIIGASASVVAVLPGWWWVERLGVGLILAGILIYEGVVIHLHVTGPPGSSRLSQAGFVIFGACLFLLRLILTRKWDYEPRRQG